MSHAEQPAGRDSLRELSEAFAKVAEQLLARGLTLDEAVSAFATGYARAALARHSGNLSQTAAVLGIHRNTLRSKLRNGHRSG